MRDHCAGSEIQVLYRVGRQRADDGHYADAECHRHAEALVQGRFPRANEQDLRGERDQLRDEYGGMHVQDHWVGRVVVRDMSRDFTTEAEHHPEPDQRDIDEKKRTVSRVGGCEFTPRRQRFGDGV